MMGGGPEHMDHLHHWYQWLKEFIVPVLSGLVAIVCGAIAIYKKLKGRTKN